MANTIMMRMMRTQSFLDGFVKWYPLITPLLPL